MKRLDKRRLTKKLALHEAWLRDEPNGERADFSGSLLHRRDFRGRNLQYAKFEGADLTGSSFEKANLNGARFYKSTLMQVNFSGSTLIETDFIEADLRGAALNHAVVTQTKFQKALFSVASSLTGIKENEANFQQARVETNQGTVPFNFDVFKPSPIELALLDHLNQIHTKHLSGLGKPRPKSSKEALEVSIEIPDHWDEATTTQYLESLAVQINTWHREEGGHGLKIDAIGVEDEVEALKPLVQ